MVVELESIQIQSLQKIIKCQDELIRNEVTGVDDICSVWKNECYRLSTQKQIAEEESVRMGLQCLEVMELQRNQIALAVKQALETVSREHERSITQRIVSIEKRLHSVERSVRKLSLIHHTSLDLDLPAVSLENTHLARRNMELEEQVKSLKAQLRLAELERDRLASELAQSIETRMKPTTPSKGVDVAINASPGTASEIKLLLAELKSLEAEAKQMLINP